MNPGDKLGPYEIVEPIGKGGMGAVYRARDTRLGRDVAIKVSDQKFGERFEREARVISSLNHPNICHLYDVGDNFLVMELVEGETLADRIRVGAIPLEESLAIARQIADALEAAHEKGITHRDLKPGNVMVTEDGAVKVLDFGLAKVAATASASGGDPELSPTISMHATQAGVILGTAAYMAPEQARGKNVDKRADIWAFGVVLHEMVTGKKPFVGEDLTETLAFVVSREPDLSAAPLELQPLLKKCLEKDPRKRLRDISGVELLLESGRLAASLRAENRAAPEDRPVSARLSWAPWLAAGLLLLLAAAGWLRTSASVQPAIAMTIVPPVDKPLVEAASRDSTPQISPDGSAVLYKSSDGSLYVRRLDSLEAIPVPESQGATFPFWSPDSSSVFFARNRTLTRVRLPDGGPEAVLQLAGSSRGGSVNEDGAILYSDQERLRLWAPGGEVQTPEIPGVMDAARYPEFLPNGKDFLVSTLNDYGVYLATLQDGRVVDPVLLFESHTPVRYTPAGGGRVVFVRNDNLYSQRLDLNERKLVGAPQLIQEGIASLPGLTVNNADFSVSRSGAVAWRPGRALSSQVTVFNRNGAEVGTVGPPILETNLRLSPDGTRLLASAVTQTTQLLDVGQTGSLDLGEEGNWLFWSADGSRIIGEGYVDGIRRVFERAVTGGEITVLGDHDDLNDGTILDLSPDGKQLLFRDKNTGGLMVRQFGGPPEDREPKLLAPSSGSAGSVGNATFSPDGRWIVYAQGGLFVQPFPGPGLRRQISAQGSYPLWRGDGREILYLQDGGVHSVSVAVVGNQLQFGAPVDVFNGGLVGVSGNTPWAVSRDGSRIYWLQFAEQPGSNVIHVRTNAVR